MHRSDALQRQVVVHHGEHTLLHLSTVPCVNDYLLMACDVEYYSCLRIEAQLLIVLNLSLRSIIYYEVRLEVRLLFCCWTDEHILNEMCLPSYFHDETNCHTCVCICSAETIDDIQLLVRKLLLSNILNCLPSLLRCSMVIVLILVTCPPYSVLRIIIHNDELILRRTSCVNSCEYVNCTKLSLMTYFVSLKTLFGLLCEELFIRWIVNNLSCVSNTVLC